MLEKDFNWNHRDKQGHFHKWNNLSPNVSPFLDDSETFDVLYQYWCNTLLVQCRECKDVFLAAIKGGDNAV